MQAVCLLLRWEREHQTFLRRVKAPNSLMNLLDPTGGNAGMAAAYSARQLGIPATIVVPSVTPNPTVERLKDEGATVIVHGKVG